MSCSQLFSQTVCRSSRQTCSVSWTILWPEVIIKW